MLSWVVQWNGRLDSWLVPFRSGPRHWGQFSAMTAGTERIARINASRMRIISAGYLEFQVLYSTPSRNNPFAGAVANRMGGRYRGSSRAHNSAAPRFPFPT